MAGDLLMSVSKDERERAIFRSRRMYQSDLDSNIATAEKRGEIRGEIRGEKLGVIKGEKIGVIKGEKIGVTKGEQRKALAIAANMLKRARSIDEIIEDTGLTREEVENLRERMS